MSLRARVALATALASALIVVVAGALVVATFRHGAERRVDAQLSDQWRDLSQIAVSVARSERPAVEQLLDLGVQAPLAVRVIDAGEVALSLGAPGLEHFDTVPPAGLSTVVIDGDRWRVLADTVTARSRPVRLVEVQFASPLAALESSVADLRARIVRVGLLVVMAAGVLGWVVGSTALRPIARLRARAADLAKTSDLSLRVESELGASEVDELAADLNRMLQRLEDGERSRLRALESARSFAAAAAHELRTPLTSMQANIDVLRRIDELGEVDRASLVEDLATEQQRLREVLEALRMLARGDVTESATFTDVDLADIIQLAVADARHRYPGIQCTVDVAAAPPTICGWPEGLRVMIDNLLTNAATHGASAGEPGRIVVSARQHENRIVVMVGDDGPGVPPEEREHILERFRRGSTAQGTGSGLGLALVAQQAELHSGKVTVGSSSLGGAEFRVELASGGTATAREASHLPQRIHNDVGEARG